MQTDQPSSIQSLLEEMERQSIDYLLRRLEQVDEGGQLSGTDARMIQDTLRRYKIGGVATEGSRQQELARKARERSQQRREALQASRKTSDGEHDLYGPIRITGS